MDSHGRSQHAFTLTELLIVIVIIGVLIGLLLPAISSVRASGRTTQCAAQARSIASLTAAFMTERRDQAPIAGRLWSRTRARFTREFLPPGLTYYTESGPASIERPLPFFATLAEFSGVELDLSSIDVLRQQLGSTSSLVPQAQQFFNLTRCPDDKTFNPEDTSHVGMSLLPNDLSWTVTGGLGEMTSYMVNEWALGESPELSRRKLGRLALVHQPARVMLAADGEPRILEPPVGINYMLIFDDETQNGFTMADYNRMYQSYAPPEEFSRGFFYQFGFPLDLQTGAIYDGPRHRGATNVSFIDGHTSTLPLSEDALENVMLSDP